jgi:glucosamine--fructose-6-phosphate aminotransferase (isomerizing)
MFVLAQIASRLGGRFEEALNALPGQVEAVLAREDESRNVARMAAERLVYATGAGPKAATALEVVIKAREAAAAKIDALPLEQFLHGPLITVEAEDLAILVNVKGANPGAATRVAEIARLLDRIGTRSAWSARSSRRFPERSCSSCRRSPS